MSLRWHHQWRQGLGRERLCSAVANGQDVASCTFEVTNPPFVGGDNFVRSFNFNNDTKTWTFYSPDAPDDSTQTRFMTGESYWILIGDDQEVILNCKTVLICSGHCWNQIVW